MTRRKSLMVLVSAVLAASALWVCCATAQPEDGRTGEPARPSYEGLRGVLAQGAGRGGYRSGDTEGMRTSGPGGPMSDFAGVVENLTRLCFDNRGVAVLAIGAMKEDVQRKLPDAAKDLEGLLEKVKTQGLRNAIHLTLKDIYKRMEDNEKVLEHLRALVAENDKAIQEQEKSGK